MSTKHLLFIVGLLLLIGSVHATTTTFYLSEDTGDEWMRGEGPGTFTTIRADTGDSTGDGEQATKFLILRASATTDQYNRLYRFGYGFDTSSLPDDASISSVVFGLNFASKQNGLGDLGLTVTGFAPATANNFDTGDFDAFTDTLYVTNLTYADVSVAGGYTNFTGNAAFKSAINKTGYTNFMLRFERDLANSATGISWANAAETSFAIYDYTEDAAKQPYLVITYTSAGTDPYASYVPPTITGDEPLNVTFTDISYNSPTLWNYSFQNVTGNNTKVWFSNGTTQNPYHIFDSGNFLISLYTSNGDGNNETPTSQKMWVNVSGMTPPVANFSSYLTTKQAPASFYMYDTSTNTPTSWEWHIENGTLTGISSDYWIDVTDPGDYWVSLTVCNDGGCDTENKTDYIHATEAPTTTPIANFTANETEIIEGETVGFYDLSQYATSWSWTIDGHTYSTQNPTYTFNTPGLYDVSLQAINVNGTQTMTKEDYITVSAGSWEYSSPGVFYWVCPPGLTSVFMNIAGAGGGGHGGWSSGGSRYAGHAGSPGEYYNTSSITVVPGTNYTIVVGTGGMWGAYGGDAGAGGGSSALGIYVDGGAAGLALPAISPLGEDAEDTNFMSTALIATNGTAGTLGRGGYGGHGYGAGGGGGASDAALASGGGYGAVGYVGITAESAGASNIPQFNGYPRTGASGTMVQFTDTSTIRNTANMTYLWDFGDGTTSTTIGSVSHVYSYTGTYTVNLSITSDFGTVSERKGEYISITKEDTSSTWFSQKLVRLNIVDAYGTPLEGANVTVSYIASSLPNTDTSWLMTAFGVDPTVAAEMVNGSIGMRGNTGTDGAITFMMFPAIQYGISITNATMGLSKYVSVYPQDSDYTIRCILDGQVAPVSRQTSLANSTLYVTEPNASYVTFNIIYQDVSDKTTNIKWNVTCLTNSSVVYSKDFGDPGTALQTDNYTVPTEPRGTEYRAMYNATRDV